MSSLSSIFAFILAILALHAACGDVNEVPLPEIIEDEWWGPEDAVNGTDTSITPFRITFPEEMIKDIRYRLRSHRIFTSPLKDAAFTYGFNLNELRLWGKYWADEYPFEKREQFLNKFPQYTTNIQGRKIHFLRVQSKNKANKAVIPIMMLHGWPGSVREFYETIPLMLKYSEDRDFALDIIVPSLPGFGFSEGALRPEFGVDKIAVVCRNLMHRIGYKRFCLQGGDLGFLVATNIATFFPDEVIGYHTNNAAIRTPEILFRLFLGAWNPERIARPEVVNRIYPLSTHISDLMDESGYFHIQSTRPDTVGVGVSDSPIGMAAYVLEKFSSITRKDNKYYPDGRLTSFFTKDHLIDNLMIYWTSNCMITAMRLYAETNNKRYNGLKLNEIESPVPTCIIQADNEISYLPPWMVKKKFPNLLNETVIFDAGHFLAFEKPEIFAQNVLDAIDTFRFWHKAQK